MNPVFSKVWVFDNACSLRGQIFKGVLTYAIGRHVEVHTYPETLNPSKEVYRAIEEPTTRVSTRVSSYLTDKLY